MATKKYETKDSGKRQIFPSSMQRDTQEGKDRYDLIYEVLLDRVLSEFNGYSDVGLIGFYGSFNGFWESKDEDMYVEFARDLIIREMITKNMSTMDCLDLWQGVMARGAKKYNDHNWKKACTQEEYDRFFASGFRHLMQYLRGEDDECHFAGVLFNVGGMLYVSKVLRDEKKGIED